MKEKTKSILDFILSTVGVAILTILVIPGKSKTQVRDDKS